VATSSSSSSSYISVGKEENKKDQEICFGQQYVMFIDHLLQKVNA
jgi:hypothetical protein